MDRQWKLGKDLHTSDNVFDPITFDDIITALQCNYMNITLEAVVDTIKIIFNQRLEDTKYLLANNYNEIIAEAQRGRE